MVPVFSGHLVFTTKIPCTDDFVQKVPVSSDHLPNMTSNRQILCTQCHSPGLYDHVELTGGNNEAFCRLM